MAATTKKRSDPPTSLKLPKSYRVTKGLEAQESSFDAGSLAKKFAKNIDNDRTRINKEVEIELDVTAKRLSDGLDEILEGMHEMLSMTEEREAKLFAPISEEQLKLTKPTSSGKTIFTLGERMKEFDKIVRRHQEGLDKLWSEWVNIQTELIALAVEVFGSQSIQVQGDVDTRLSQSIESANLKHTKDTATAVRQLSQLRALRQSVPHATQKTIKTSEQIEQAWNHAFTKELETIKRAMKNLAG